MAFSTFASKSCGPSYAANKPYVSFHGILVADELICHGCGNTFDDLNKKKEKEKKENTKHSKLKSPPSWRGLNTILGFIAPS